MTDEEKPIDIAFREAQRQQTELNKLYLEAAKTMSDLASNPEIIKVKGDV